MSVSFRFSRGRPILVPVRMEHANDRCRPLMVLDTGARSTVITPGLATALGFKPEDVERTVEVLSATGKAWAGLLRVDSVSVLGLEVKNLDVLCHQLPSGLGLDGILGLNFLEHFRIVIDNGTETVTLSKWRE